MRFIHTADWHLGDRLGRLDRTEDLRERVEQVAELCEQHAVDALVVAGDLFSEQTTLDQMADSLSHLRKTFARFFGRGGTIVAVTGNHDRDTRINMIREGMALAVPVSKGGALQPGRMYLQNGRVVATVESRGRRVQFVLVPYPTAHRYLEPEDRYQSKEEENTLLHARVLGWLNGLQESGRLDVCLPTVLVAHLHVRGAEVHSLYRMTDRDDVIFESGGLPTGWHYCALGHVHRPQTLGGMDHVRYPGPLDRLDFGERNDERGVLLVEIDPEQARGRTEWLPLKPTPFLDVCITDVASELPRMDELYPEREVGIARIRIHPQTQGSRSEITREVRRLFPRWTEVSWLEDRRAVGMLPPNLNVRLTDHRDTVRTYLHERLKEDPDREALLALAERFLNEGGTK